MSLEEKYHKENPKIAKNLDAMINHKDGCFETLPEYLDSYITPNEVFFVRSNGSVPEINAENYRLIIEGDAVDTPLELTLDDIYQLPSKTLFAYLECAGNHRKFFDTLLEKPTPDTQWQTGGVGMAEWTGVGLADVLALAKPHEDAINIQLVGLDLDAPENGFRRTMPIEKAMDTDTILAYAMNGSVLPQDHGYPLRAVVPGWVGSSSIKWLGKIIVSSKRLWGRNNTNSYVLIGDDYDRDEEAEGEIATTQSIKSALTLPFPATIQSRKQTIRGFAQSPYAPVKSVEWSVDQGKTWNQARVLEPRLKYAWVRFEFSWEPAPGEYTITTRAIDEDGNSQHQDMPYNKKGYLFNIPVPHPITVE